MTAQELQNIERAFRTGLSIGFGFTPANYTPEEINKTWNNFKKSIDNGHFNKGYSADVYNDQLIINIPVEKIIEMTECDDLKVIDKDMFLSVLCDSIGYIKEVKEEEFRTQLQLQRQKEYEEKHQEKMF